MSRTLWTTLCGSGFAFDKREQMGCPAVQRSRLLIEIFRLVVDACHARFVAADVV